MRKKTNERFDYLMNTMMNNEENEIRLELSKEEKDFFQNIDLTEVLFI